MTDIQPNNVDIRIKMTSEKEVELLKSTFKGNDELLKATRMLLYGLPVSESNTILISNTFSNPDLKQAFRRKLYPIFAEDIPDIAVNSLADFWYGTEANVNGRDRDTINQNIYSKEKLLTLLGQAMSLLSNPNGEKIDLTYTPSELDPLGISLITRNLYIRTINEGINIIKMICDQEAITPEKLKEKQKQNSSK